MLNKGAYSGSCAVGLSGLVFGLIAVDNAVSGVHQRSIFGFFTVPAKVTPAAAGHMHSRLDDCKQAQFTCDVRGLL